MGHTYFGPFSPLEADRAESVLSQGLDPWTQSLLSYLFTRVTLLWSSGAAPDVDEGLVSRSCRRGTGAARDQHTVDLPGEVAL
jgi:hypothetical protein